MNTHTKTIYGQLLNIDSKDTVADVSVEIVETESHNSPQKPSYFIKAIMDGYKPDIAEQVYLLQLNEKISGEVSLRNHLIKQLDFDNTVSIFNVQLQDTFWLKTKWFEAL